MIRNRMGQATATGALPPGWAMGPNGIPYNVAESATISSEMLWVTDARGNRVQIPAGFQLQNWTNVQNAVNAGTMTIEQVAALPGASPVSYAPGQTPAAAAPPPPAPPAAPPAQYFPGPGAVIVRTPPFNPLPSAPPAPSAIAAPTATLAQKYYAATGSLAIPILIGASVGGFIFLPKGAKLLALAPVAFGAYLGLSSAAL